MNESPGSASPAQLMALVGLPLTVYANLSVKDTLLEIVVPFGKVILSYSRIAHVTKDVYGTIRLDVVGGATVSLGVISASDRDALFVLLQQKIMKHGGRPISFSWAVEGDG